MIPHQCYIKGPYRTNFHIFIFHSGGNCPMAALHDKSPQQMGNGTFSPLFAVSFLQRQNIFAFDSLTVTKRAKSPFKVTWLIYELTAGEFILVTAVKVTDSTKYRVLNTITSSFISWIYYFRHFLQHIFNSYFSIYSHTKLSKKNQKAVKIFYCLMFKCFFLSAAALGAKIWALFPVISHGGSGTEVAVWGAGRTRWALQGSSTPCSSHTNPDFITR